MTPEPGGTTSDDHQQGYAQGYTEGRAAGWDERGELGGVLDRDALIRHIRETVWDDYEASATAEEVADGILALVRRSAGTKEGVVTPRELVDRAVVAYVTGGLEALQEVTGPDPVESPVFWEAVSRIGANRRALNTGRRPRSGIDKWDRGTFSAEEQHDDDRHERRGGNL